MTFNEAAAPPPYSKPGKLEVRRLERHQPLHPEIQQGHQGRQHQPELAPLPHNRDMAPEDTLSIRLPLAHWDLIQATLLFTLSAKGGPDETDKEILVQILLAMSKQLEAAASDN